MLCLLMMIVMCSGEEKIVLGVRAAEMAGGHEGQHEDPLKGRDQEEQVMATRYGDQEKPEENLRVSKEEKVKVTPPSDQDQHVEAPTPSQPIKKLKAKSLLYKNRRRLASGDVTYDNDLGWDCPSSTYTKVGDRDIRFNRCTFKFSDSADADKKKMCRTYTSDTDCEASGCEWNYPPVLLAHKMKCEDTHLFKLKIKGTSANMNADHLTVCQNSCK